MLLIIIGAIVLITIIGLLVYAAIKDDSDNS